MDTVEQSGRGPIIELDALSPVPKYQQIVEQVEALAASGALPPGTPLPSVRQLSADLGINVNTVLVAYHALEAEDIVVLRRGSRAIVHPRLARLAAATPDADALARIRAQLGRVRTEALLAGIGLDQLSALAAEIFGGGQPAHAQAPEEDH